MLPIVAHVVGVVEFEFPAGDEAGQGNGAIALSNERSNAGKRKGWHRWRNRVGQTGASIVFRHSGKNSSLKPTKRAIKPTFRRLPKS